MNKRIILSIITFLTGYSVFSQDLKKSTAFEGSIEFMQCIGTDTTFYSYDIKSTHVRIKNIDVKSNKDIGIYLMDLSAKTTIAISPLRRIYKDEPTPATVKVSGDPKVTKTTNTKTINGYKCTEYVVENAKDGIKISYWIANGNFEFFLPMMNILNRSDNFSLYYMQIKNSQNMFPMEAYETDLSGTAKGFMKATKVTAGTVAAQTFVVPEGYKKFEK
jgi:hypothetical protein